MNKRYFARVDELPDVYVEGDSVREVMSSILDTIYRLHRLAADLKQYFPSSFTIRITSQEIPS